MSIQSYDICIQHISKRIFIAHLSYAIHYLKSRCHPSPHPNDRGPMITFMLQTPNVFQLRTQARNEAVPITRGGGGFHPHIFNISITQSSIGVAAWRRGGVAEWCLCMASIHGVEPHLCNVGLFIEIHF